MSSFGKRPIDPTDSAFSRSNEPARVENGVGADDMIPSGASEHRVVRRKRSLKGAYISYNDRHFTIPCAVRDISGLGARLKVSERSIAPDTFILHIELDSTEMDCEVVWRSKDEVGVKFVSDVRSVKVSRIQVVSSSDHDVKSLVRRHPVR
jgi:PilZ domain